MVDEADIENGSDKRAEIDACRFLEVGNDNGLALIGPVEQASFHKVRSQPQPEAQNYQ
jgi:hypothetical protein